MANHSATKKSIKKRLLRLLLIKAEKLVSKLILKELW